MGNASSAALLYGNLIKLRKYVISKPFPVGYEGNDNDSQHMNTYK